MLGIPWRTIGQKPGLQRFTRRGLPYNPLRIALRPRQNARIPASAPRSPPKAERGRQSQRTPPRSRSNRRIDRRIASVSARSEPIAAAQARRIIADMENDNVQGHQTGRRRKPCQRHQRCGVDRWTGRNRERYEAVLWSPSGKATVLQDVGGRGQVYADAVNDAGWSVGQSETATGYDAVLWSPSGKATVLQDVGGENNSVAVAINDAGWSVGSSDTNAFGNRMDAVLWSPSGKATVLQDVGGWDDSYAVAINNAGWSVEVRGPGKRLRGGAVVAVWESDSASGRWRPGRQRRRRHQRRRAERRRFGHCERRSGRGAVVPAGRRRCFRTPAGGA